MAFDFWDTPKLFIPKSFWWLYRLIFLTVIFFGEDDSDRNNYRAGHLLVDHHYCKLFVDLFEDGCLSKKTYACWWTCFWFYFACSKRRHFKFVVFDTVVAIDFLSLSDNILCLSVEMCICVTVFWKVMELWHLTWSLWCSFWGEWWISYLSNSTNKLLNGQIIKFEKQCCELKQPPRIITKLCLSDIGKYGDEWRYVKIC